MSVTDPISDMLTRIRNANMVGHESVEVPSSNCLVYTSDAADDLL